MALPEKLCHSMYTAGGYLLKIPQFTSPYFKHPAEMRQTSSFNPDSWRESAVQSISRIRLFGTHEPTPGLPVHHQLLEILALIPALIQSALAGGADKTRDLKEEEPVDETGWNLGTSPVLQCLPLDSPLLQQQNTKKLYGTKNNCLPVQWGQILDNIHKKTEKPNCYF